jgi:hypothetical protein
VRVPHDPGDSVERRNLFGRSLRVTARDDNPSAGVRSMDFSNRIASLRIRGSSNRASIQHYEVGRGMLTESGEACREQTAAKRGGVCIGGAAAEIFNGESSHKIQAKLNRIEIIAADRFFEAAESFEREE